MNVALCIRVFKQRIAQNIQITIRERLESMKRNALLIEGYIFYIAIEVLTAIKEKRNHCCVSSFEKFEKNFAEKAT